MSDVRTFTKTTRLQGEVRAPGELRAAAQALWLAAIADGESRFEHVPPEAAATLDILEGLGVSIKRNGDGHGIVTVQGNGLGGLEPSSQTIDLDVPQEAALPALAILSQQAFVSRVRIAPESREAAMQLLALLARTGAAGVEEAEFLLRLDGTESPGGVRHEESDLPGAVKLGLLTAGLFAEVPTVVRESPSSKDRVDALLKIRGVAVEGSRQADPTVRTMTLTPGAAPEALDMDIPGDVSRAMPFVVAGLSVPRSEVTVRRVMLRPENRVFVDIVRQIGAELEIADNDDGSVDLVLKASGRMKATRVAGKRAQSLLDHVALLAVLATQTEGEFIIRDVESLRQGEFDFIEHLADLLRAIEAKVGEYSYGLVIDGGRPLKGARIKTRRHPGLTQAFSVAGLLATGDMDIEDTACVDPVFPGFFDQLDALRSPRKKEKTT
ncbi:MAG TPA: hypothetical protein QGF95_21785 [Candidatus Latescibacteria bacterium]|nr:hypothetical protein [Candidatus Latescibacterota bacterium]HJP33186.1 hypothetical protein [Candidatus Latescibacterota bacterium]